MTTGVLILFVAHININTSVGKTLGHRQQGVLAAHLPLHTGEEASLSAITITK